MKSYLKFLLLLLLSIFVITTVSGCKKKVKKPAKSIKRQVIPIRAPTVSQGIPARKTDNALFGNVVPKPVQIPAIPVKKLPAKMKARLRTNIMTALSVAAKGKKVRLEQPLFILILMDKDKRKELDHIGKTEKNMKKTLLQATKLLQKWTGVKDGKICGVTKEGLDKLGLLVTSRPARVPQGFSLVTMPAGDIMEAMLGKRFLKTVPNADKGTFTAVLDWYWQIKHGLSLVQPLLIVLENYTSLRVMAPIKKPDANIKRLSRLYILQPHEMNLPGTIHGKLSGLSRKNVKALRTWLLRWSKDNAKRGLKKKTGQEGPQPSYKRNKSQKRQGKKHHVQSKYPKSKTGR